ncbi:integrin alpha-4-like [Babylonia areolata]|uniref:integrin alpha-4-like n=1 Tax=Babylonia areolata TaxID=304850 RepID=UPI003FD05C05
MSQNSQNWTQPKTLRPKRGRRREGVDWGHWTQTQNCLGTTWATCLLCLLSCLTPVVGFNVDTVTPIIYKGPKGSYFGYSVAMLENRKGGWILVGAPNAEDSSVGGGTIRRPGALFQCNWQFRSSCRPILIDKTGNEKQIIPKHKNITVVNKKDFQWLGASVDVNYYGNENVVVCAPRWKDGEYEVQGHVFMNGLCYEASKELDFNPSSPWPVLDSRHLQIHSRGHLVYAMGSVGTSAHYSKDGSFLLLGAPGLNDWTGGFVRIAGGLRSRAKVVDPSRKVYNNSYIGYSITTAHLTPDAVYTLVSGPRADNVGKVIGYNYKLDTVLVKEGEQYGSYFGAVVCAADLNGDKLDDLLVGAPMYMDKYDEGRVYVYINKEFFNLELMTPLLSGSNAPGARFGTAITNLGDINNDLFDDIAIGAPYEATTGVVYIYNGGEAGLHQKYSQRIAGSDIDSGLRAFGYAISRPWDIDRNYYADFVVGAYGSDRAVLLRTRSVLDLEARFDVSSSRVSHLKPRCQYQKQPTPCLTATVCLKYSGINLPPATEVKITLKLDTLERHRGERRRLFVMDPADQGREVEETSAVVELRQDLWACVRSYTVYVRESRDVITPLQMDLHYDIPPNVPGISTGCDICPIRNIYSPTTKSRQVIYTKGCGADDVCSSDLHLQAWPVFDRDPNITKLLIDNSPMFEVDVHINNTGEIAYLTYVTVSYPESVKFSQAMIIHGNSAVLCTLVKSPNVTMSLECDLALPVVAGVEVVFRLRFFTAALPFNLTSFNVSLEAKTASREPVEKLLDNFVNVTVPVEIRSLVKLHSTSMPAQLKTPRSVAAGNTSVLHLTHLYILHNQGPSPFPHGSLTIRLPRTPLIWLSNVQAKSRNSGSKIPLHCEVADGSDGPKSQKKQGLYAEKQPKPTQPSTPVDSDLVCEEEQCTEVHCQVGMMHRDEAFLISLNISVRLNILHRMKVGRQLRITSSAVFEQPDLLSFVSMSTLKEKNTTTRVVYETQVHTAFAWWVLGVSIVSGFLLLYLLIILLWKCGFFRRKSREELQKLIETSSHPEECEALQPPSPDSISSGPPPFSSIAEDGDVMVLPPSTPFYPHPLEQTFSLRNNNNTIGSNFNSSYDHRSNSLGYRERGCRGERVVGGSLGRHYTPHHEHWTPPPPPPLPAFNNQLYLEPLEHTV